MVVYLNSQWILMVVIRAKSNSISATSAHCFENFWYRINRKSLSSVVYLCYQWTLLESLPMNFLITFINSSFWPVIDLTKIRNWKKKILFTRKIVLVYPRLYLIKIKLFSNPANKCKNPCFVTWEQYELTFPIVERYSFRCFFFALLCSTDCRYRYLCFIHIDKFR